MKRATRGNTPRTPFWFRRPQLLDLGAQILVGLVVVTGVVVVLLTHPVSLAALVGLGVSGLGFGLSLVRRWIGFVVVALAPITVAVLGADPIYSWNIAIFAVFSMALRGIPGIAAGAIIGVVNYGSVYLFDPTSPIEPEAVVAGLAAFAAGAAGSAIRAQARYWQELEGRATDALATRDLVANARVAEERLRIAHDLHDVIGHEISVINMHLGVAEVNLPGGSETSLKSLRLARGGVQSVLRETQSILSVLRRGETVGEGRDPAPSIDRVTGLLDKVRSGGMLIDSDIADLPADLDPTVSSAAFRIVQEGLTNVQRYGRGKATLKIDVDRQTLNVQLTNPIGKRGSDSEERTGLGLVGMRERASSAGGKLVVRDLGDVFEVIAQFPLHGGRL